MGGPVGIFAEPLGVYVSLSAHRANEIARANENGPSRWDDPLDEKGAISA